MGNSRLGLQEGRGLLRPETREVLGMVPMSPAHLLKAPAIRHGGDHLRELLLLALQHAVHVLGRDLQAEGRRGAPQEGDESLPSPLLLSSHPPTPEGEDGSGRVGRQEPCPKSRLHAGHFTLVVGFSWRLREGELLAQGHPAKEWQGVRTETQVIQARREGLGRHSGSLTEAGPPGDRASPL